MHHFFCTAVCLGAYLPNCLFICLRLHANLTASLSARFAKLTTYLPTHLYNNLSGHTFKVDDIIKAFLNM